MKLFFQKWVLWIFLLAFIIAPTFVHAAYVSDICPGDPYSTTVPCPESAVGPFMAGITNLCGNTGRCTLADLMTVVANVGNFVLRIVGSLLLLFYVYGGVCYLISHGNQDWVKKGKTAIKTSTVGLVIVMFAYLGVTTLKTSLLNQKATNKPNETFIVCGGPDTENKSCGPNQVCNGGACVSECELSGGTCMGVVDPSKPPAGFKSCSATSGLCPSDGDTCCKK